MGHASVPVICFLRQTPSQPLTEQYAVSDALLTCIKCHVTSVFKSGRYQCLVNTPVRIISSV